MFSTMSNIFSSFTGHMNRDDIRADNEIKELKEFKNGNIVSDNENKEKIIHVPNLDDFNNNLNNNFNEEMIRLESRLQQDIHLIQITDNSTLKTTEQQKYEELEEMTKLLHDIEVIKEIQETLLGIIGEQKETLHEMEENVIKTNDIIESSNCELLEVDKQKVAYTGTKFTVSTVTTGVVAAVSLPLIGMKAGAILTTIYFLGGTAWALWPQTTTPTDTTTTTTESIRETKS